MKSAETAFVKRNNHREMLCYIKYHELCEDSQLKLIKRGNHSEIMAYINRSYPFTENAEVCLVKRGNVKEISAYINLHDLKHKAQMELIAGGTFISLYMQKHCFTPIAELALIQRGNHNEIMDYITKYPLACNAQIALVRRKVNEETEAYARLHKFNRVAQMQFARLSRKN